MTAFFSRIKEVKPHNFIHHFKRYYFQIPATRFVNQTAASQRLSDYYLPTNSPRIRAIFQRRDELYNSRVRFFAAPVQVKKKEEVTTPSRPRLNEEIKADIVRVVTDEGHSVVSRNEALKRAKNLELDLVEVDRCAKPPVCKIMDYNRERYKKQVREKERAKIKSAGSLKRGGCKEVRFSAKTESKDLKMKADTIKRLMERGYRVKCMATGTEDQDLSGILSQLSALIEDDAFVEERRQAYIIVRHVKFGMSKKGGKKASKDKTADSPEIHNVATACSDSPADLGGESEELDMDNDDEAEVPLQCQEESAWAGTSASSGDQNFDKMFDLTHNARGITSSYEKHIRFDREAVASTANNNATRFCPPGVSNFTGPNVRPVAQETENRYARSTAKNTSAVKNPLRFPNDGTHPHPHPHPSVPPPKGPRQGGLEGSPPRNLSFSPDEIPQRKGELQNRSSQRNSNLVGSIGHEQRPSNTGALRSQTSGFGMFSSTKIDANNPNCTSFPDVTRISGPGQDPGNLNPPISRSDASQKSESADKKWGIFSK